MAKRKQPQAPPRAEIVPLEREVEVSVLPIGAFSQDKANVRKHNARNKDAVATSLKVWGPGRSIVVDKDLAIPAGNQTFEVAPEAGITEVILIRPDRNQLVAVHRPDWSKTEAAAYGIMDNRSSDLAADSWTDDAPKIINALIADGVSLESIGFDEDEIKDLVHGLTGEEPAAKGTGLDALAALNTLDPAVKVAKGEAWHLGRHLMVCCDLYREWHMFAPHLQEGDIFLPYPSPFAPLALDGGPRAVIVQPQPYLASVTASFYQATHPGEEVAKAL